MIYRLLVLFLMSAVSLGFSQDTIQGKYSYTYGDKESLVEARQTCKDLAIRDAIESYYIFVESSTNVENYQLKEDLIQSIAAGYLKDLKILEQTEEGRTITITIQATVLPDEVKNLVQGLATDQDSEKENADTENVDTDSSKVSKKTDVKKYGQFVDALIEYKNQTDSMESNLKKKKFKKAISSLVIANRLIERNKPDKNNRFSWLMYQMISYNNLILKELLKIERMESQGKIRPIQSHITSLRNLTIQLKLKIDQLQNEKKLTKAQQKIRKFWIARCRNTLHKAKNKYSYYNKRTNK
jgi:hypothetical protein